MRAGELRHQVELQQRMVARDSFGAELITWQTLATFDARISPLSGRERAVAQSQGQETSHEVVMRWDPLLADPRTVQTCRLLYGTRVFDIHGVLNEDERDRWVTLLVSEGLTTG